MRCLHRIIRLVVTDHEKLANIMVATRNEIVFYPCKLFRIRLDWLRRAESNSHVAAYEATILPIEFTPPLLSLRVHLGIVPFFRSRQRVALRRLYRASPNFHLAVKIGLEPLT